MSACFAYASVSGQGRSLSRANLLIETGSIHGGRSPRGQKVRPVTIVEILKKRAIKIAPPQASMVLKKMGFKRRKRRAAGAAQSAGSVVKKTGNTGLSIEDLIKAKKMAEEFGGAEKLVNAISALVELQ